LGVRKWLKIRKIKEVVQPPVPQPPQILPLLGIILMPNAPLIRDAHPIAITTPLGIVPISRAAFESIQVEFKKLEINKKKEEYFS